LKISGYELDLQKAINQIKQANLKRICIQLPEGLKFHSDTLVDYLQKETKTDVFVSADTCFGACDLIYTKLKDYEIDIVIQIGHLPIPDLKDTNTIFVNASSSINPIDTIKKALPRLVGKKIGILTTAQHISYIDNIRELLKSNGFIPFLGEGDSRIYSKGQILGCNFSSARAIKDKVDSFLFIGSGNFHSLGLILSTNKPVVSIDPYTGEIKDKKLEEFKDLILRQRYGAIARAKDAKNFGILITTKQGQQRKNRVNEIIKLIKSKNKKSYKFVLDNITPSNIESFRYINCFVSTACPRIAIDDYMQYKTPIITPIELEILLDKIKWDDYKFDEIF
jgi:2-(3-amino-3-carboxypropyl)histidine synthase